MSYNPRLPRLPTPPPPYLGPIDGNGELNEETWVISGHPRPQYSRIAPSQSSCSSHPERMSTDIMVENIGANDHQPTQGYSALNYTIHVTSNIPPVFVVLAQPPTGTQVPNAPMLFFQPPLFQPMFIPFTAPQHGGLFVRTHVTRSVTPIAQPMPYNYASPTPRPTHPQPLNTPAGHNTHATTFNPYAFSSVQNPGPSHGPMDDSMLNNLDSETADPMRANYLLFSSQGPGLPRNIISRGDGYQPTN